MENFDREQVTKALYVTAKVIGTELDEETMRVMLSELSEYGTESSLKSLRRCYRECKYKLTLADIIERLPADPSNLTAEQGWSMAVKARLWDEFDSAVVPNVVAGAFIEYALPLWENGDRVAARMAFKDSWDSCKAQLVDMGKDPFGPHLVSGYNPEKRMAALQDAVSRGFIDAEQARLAMPEAEFADPDNEWTRQLSGMSAMPQIEGSA